MLTQILKHTPTWVFILFFVLLLYGLTQTRSKQLRASRLAVLPVVMLLLSVIGLYTALGSSLLGLVCWLLGIGMAVILGRLKGAPQGARYSTQTRLFCVPGSWVPLALMMVIFFSKYAVGVILARHSAIAKTETFVVVVAVLYGFFSGLFLSRALTIWQLKGQQAEAVLN